MTTSRMVGVLLGLALVGVAVVAIRVDQARVWTRVEKLQFQETDLKREIARQEMEMARLRSPAAIREQAERLGLEVASRASVPAAPPPRATPPARRGGR
ncbi:MAG: hypothetical protein HRF43_00070 [Phycisphaerae bacterium]|jgi:septal ring factor EnvC (AmiA/AmiB activator)